MWVADEMQRLADQWPALPVDGDSQTTIPPIKLGYGRLVSNTSPRLEIVYSISTAGLYIFTVRRA